MEKTYKRVPFDIELAKDIQSGKIEGKIVTVNSDPIRVLAFDIKDKFPIVVAVTRSNGNEIVYTCESTGKYLEGYSNSFYDLAIELLEEAPKQMTLGQCKKGDEVWILRNYDYGPEYVKVKVGKYSLDTPCGPSRNVIFENGFTCQELASKTCWKENPKETPNHILKKEKVLYKQYKNSSILLDKILKAVGNDFDEKEKESFKIVKKYLDDIISMQFNRLEETPKQKFKKGDFVEIIDGDEMGMIGTIRTGNVVQLNGVLCCYVDMCDGNDSIVAVPIQYIVKRENLCDTTKNNDFKLFDRVLVRNHTDERWKPGMFWCETTRHKEDAYKTIDGDIYKQCIPYEGNEHLVGTTDNPD